MTPIFRLFDLDQLSFWVGFATGLLFFALAIRTWPIIKQLARYAFRRLSHLRDNLTTGAGERLRRDTLRYAQRQHLASMFCALDEILIPPKVLRPPPIIDPGQDYPYEEAVNQAVPYLPDFPEYSAVFHTPSIDLAELLRHNTSLVLIGRPGAGKTVALASLASRVARRDPDIEFLSERLPIFLHALDLLELIGEKRTAFDILHEAVTRYASALTQPRLAEALRMALKNGSLLLFVDGLDELPPTQIAQVVVYLKTLKHTYPNLQMLAATSPDNHDQLTGLGFFPVALAGWTNAEKKAYREKCSVLWKEIAYSHPDQQFSEIPHAMLLNWLSASPTEETPLEYSLRVWSAFAGDPVGPTGTEAIEAYAWRMLQGTPNAILAIRRIAQNMVIHMQPAIPKRLANDLVFEYEISAMDKQPEPAETIAESSSTKETQRHQIPRQIVSNLIRNGILVERAGEQLSFAHPIIAGYLAAENFSDFNDIADLFQQPPWNLRSITIGYLNIHHDLSEHIEKEIGRNEEPVQRQKIEIGRWLLMAEPTAAWAAAFLRQCTTDLQDDFLPMSLKFRILAIMALSRETGVATLFRRFLGHMQPSVRALGCIGLGLLHDTKSISEIIQLIADPVLAVRQAACIALGAMRTQAAIEGLADALLHADEDIQICAAETLANDPEDGHEALREGSQFDDLLVRKAVTYGLVKIKAEWAIDILRKMQLEDSQWVVRNAAEQALARLENPLQGIPKPFPPLRNTAWLIAFAGESGEGIPSDEAGVEMLIKAAKDGNLEQKIAALYRLLFLPQIHESGITTIYHALYSPDDRLRETAYNVLWHITARAQKIPQPLQFGFD